MHTAHKDLLNRHRRLQRLNSMPVFPETGDLFGTSDNPNENPALSRSLNTTSTTTLPLIPVPPSRAKLQRRATVGVGVQLPTLTRTKTTWNLSMLNDEPEHVESESQEFRDTKYRESVLSIPSMLNRADSIVKDRFLRNSTLQKLSLDKIALQPQVAFVSAIQDPANAVLCGSMVRYELYLVAIAVHYMRSLSVQRASVGTVSSIFYALEKLLGDKRFRPFCLGRVELVASGNADSDMKIKNDEVRENTRPFVDIRVDYYDPRTRLTLVVDTVFCGRQSPCAFEKNAYARYEASVKDIVRVSTFDSDSKGVPVVIKSDLLFLNEVERKMTLEITTNVPSPSYVLTEHTENTRGDLSLSLSTSDNLRRQYAAYQTLVSSCKT